MAIFRFFKMAAAAAAKFLTVGTVKRVKLHHHAKFRRNRWNRGWDMAILRFLRWRPPPSWKIEKSPYLSCGLSDIDKIRLDDAFRTSWSSWPLKIGNRRLENRKMAISQPWFERFRRNLARWCSLTVLTGGRHPNKLKITISRQGFEQPSDFSLFS